MVIIVKSGFGGLGSSDGFGFTFQFVLMVFAKALIDFSDPSYEFDLCLVWFDGTSIFEGYLMRNLFLYI